MFNYVIPVLQALAEDQHCSAIQKSLKKRYSILHYILDAHAARLDCQRGKYLWYLETILSPSVNTLHPTCTLSVTCMQVSVLVVANTWIFLLTNVTYATDGFSSQPAGTVSPSPTTHFQCQMIYCVIQDSCHCIISNATLQMRGCYICQMTNQMNYADNMSMCIGLLPYITKKRRHFV